MTEKIYYTDVTCKDFTARVESRQQSPQGPAICLDRTAFYPTSGGQSHDVGTINGIAVRDVWNDAEGNIWHLLERPLDAIEVQGSINWDVRFDHMQQHTGQHLLSAAFLRLLQANTLSVHMGAAINTVDFDLSQLSWEEAFRVEEEVNRIIQENRRVTIALVGEETLADFNLRREPQVRGVIRIVQVEGYDVSPCGGTHTPYTGQIGLVKLTAIERYKGGVRVTFLCGARALRDYRHALQVLQKLGAQLSVGSDDCPDAVARLLEDNRLLRRSQQQTQQTFAEMEAQLLWQATSVSKGARRIVKHWEARSFGEIQALARQLQNLPNTAAFLMVTEGDSLRLICTRSHDLEKMDANAYLRAALGELGGRGGGTPTLAQGGAPLTPPEAALVVLNKVLADGEF
ncbi:MAG: Alanine--tRNA ligase [Chloroflexi bacterium ADurb.Bin360]|nr:MAG: Alanine--tRNA ligase [Chloroflexi bacterium ADurb.Bin360]